MDTLTTDTVSAVVATFMPSTGIGRIANDTVIDRQTKDLVSTATIDLVTLVRACYVKASNTNPVYTACSAKANSPATSARSSTAHDNYTSLQLVKAALAIGPCTHGTLQNLLCVFNAHTGAMRWWAKQHKFSVSDNAKCATANALVKGLANETNALVQYASVSHIKRLANVTIQGVHETTA